MAEEEKEEKKEEVVAKKSNKTLFIIIGVVVVLLIAGAAFFLLKPKKEAKEEVDADAAQTEAGLKSESSVDGEEALEEGEEALGAIFPMETFVVNLSGGKYVRLQVQVEFESRDVPKRFYSRIVQVKDAVITALNKKTAENLLADNGKDNIKSQVKDIINEALRKEEVKRVYITQFIVQ